MDMLLLSPQLHCSLGASLCGTDTGDITGIAGLQAAVDAPSRVAGVQLMDVSLRMLHTKKQASWQRPLVKAFQRLLRETPLGVWFFGTIAKAPVSQLPWLPLIPE